MKARKHPIQPADAPRPEALPPLNHFRTAGTDERKVLRYLLAQAWHRLRQGRSMEQERNLVFPECTAISRDIERMTRRLCQLTGQHSQDETENDELRNLISDL